MSTLRKTLFSLLLAVGLVASSQGVAHADWVGDYNGKGIKIYPEANTSKKPVGLGYRGDMVTVHHVTDGWVYHTNRKTFKVGYSPVKYMLV